MKVPRRHPRLCLLFSLFLSGLFLARDAIASGDSGEPISWPQIQEMPPPPAGKRLRYGPEPAQFGELRVPADGNGPYPVLMLLHGGCWLAQFGLDYFEHLADALTRELKVATWNVEYRRLGNSGGGWPGTFRDAATAADHLKIISDEYALDTESVIGLGHSAGGHLALWLAGRGQLEASGELYVERPQALQAVVGLAAIGDLAGYGDLPGGCNAVVSELMGGDAKQQHQRYQQGSPLALLPLGIPQWLIQGEHDGIVPPALARRYVNKAKDAGDRVSLIEIPGAGHFDPAIPGSMAWAEVKKAVQAALSPVR